MGSIRSACYSLASILSLEAICDTTKISNYFIDLGIPSDFLHATLYRELGRILTALGRYELAEKIITLSTNSLYDEEIQRAYLYLLSLQLEKYKSLNFSSNNLVISSIAEAITISEKISDNELFNLSRVAPDIAFYRDLIALEILSKQSPYLQDIDLSFLEDMEIDLSGVSLVERAKGHIKLARILIDASVAGVTLPPVPGLSDAEHHLKMASDLSNQIHQSDSIKGEIEALYAELYSHYGDIEAAIQRYEQAVDLSHGIDKIIYLGRLAKLYPDTMRAETRYEEA
ncbi:MAG: hypothetical protein AAFN93_28580, partial [Bacteroidota bacterium]